MYKDTHEHFDKITTHAGGVKIFHCTLNNNTFALEGEELMYHWYDHSNFIEHTDFNYLLLEQQKLVLAKCKIVLVTK